MRTRRLAVLILALSVPLLTAADWNRFRGPQGFGTAPDKNVPVSFGPSDVIWKAAIPGHSHSSPIVSKGKVFLQTASDDASKRALVCVDAATGNVEWTREVKGAFAKTHDKNSLASSTPAADGERIYTVFWDGRRISLSAWDYAGKQLWNRDLGTYVSQHGPGLSPIVVGDKVILNVDQDDLAEVHAYDAKTGQPVWKKSRTAYRACYTTPFVLERDGRTEVVVASTAGVTSYDPKDGAVVWNWTWVWKPDPDAPKPKGKGKGGPGGPLRHVGGPIYHNGMIFAISGDGGGDRHMVALKMEGTGDVTDNALVWQRKKETAYVPMPLAHGDYVFWVTDKENKAVCVEAKTGKEVWNERLGGSAQVTASPVLIDGKIYSVADDGKVYVFAAGPKFDLLAKNDLKEAVSASPAVADGKLYIRGANHLFCIGKK
jgi:outer membrane protein assembly factor BamB